MKIIYFQKNCFHESLGPSSLMVARHFITTTSLPLVDDKRPLSFSAVRYQRHFATQAKAFTIGRSIVAKARHEIMMLITSVAWRREFYHRVDAANTTGALLTLSPLFSALLSCIGHASALYFITV